MDFSTLLQSLQGTLGQTLPSVLGALAILIFGWFAAMLVRAAIRRGLGLLNLDRRIQESTGTQMSLERGIASVFYYVILLLVLVAFFNALALERVSSTLQALVDQVFAYAPKVAAAGLLLLVAWVLATLLRALVTRALAATTLDDRVSTAAGMAPISENLGRVVYWLVILLFLPGILGALEVRGLLDPVQSMVDQALAILPNVFAALAIGVIGWFVARVLRDLVQNLLAAAGADRLGENAGLRGTTTLSGLVGLVVYIFVFVPAIVASLNALKIEAISRPATEMLGAFMAALPNVFGAAVILGVAWFVSSFIAGLVTGLLGGAGFDRLPERVGLGALTGQSTPSEFAGKLVVFFVMLFATVEAANRLGFGEMAGLVSAMIAFGGQVLLGVAIIAIGVWISRVAHEAIKRVGSTPAVANLARFAILGIVLAMGLRAMGLADDIVNLAFGLTLGAVAVAVALSFGLGGREAAGRQMEHWLARLRQG